MPSSSILIGIYLDQKFTIPPLHEYAALFKVFLEEGRKQLYDLRKTVDASALSGACAG